VSSEVRAIVFDLFETLVSELGTEPTRVSSVGAGLTNLELGLDRVLMHRSDRPCTEPALDVTSARRRDLLLNRPGETGRQQ
jgi:hypothetical protein